MNIWEAYQQLKAGKAIKYIDDDSVVCIFRTVEEPIGVVRYKMLQEHDITSGQRPNSFRDLKPEDIEEICISMFEREDYSELSMEQLLHDAQEFWRVENT